MENYIRKNINTILTIFILISPFLDLATGICLHYFQINITLGILVRVFFLFLICFFTLFIFKKKHALPFYLLIGLYSLLYLLGIFMHEGGNGIFLEIQNLGKVFYFPIMAISIYFLRDSIKISRMSLFTTLFLYLIFLFIPIIFQFGYKTYEITKAGTLGFFNSANEIGGIISILTPLMFPILKDSKKIGLTILLMISYVIVILMMGTKTPLLAFGLTASVNFLYLWITLWKEKLYKRVFLSFAFLLIGIIGFILIVPKTNFYKNIKTHLDFLEVESVIDVLKDEKLLDHFIFSSRLAFLKDKAKIYQEAPFYQKLFGIGYLYQGKETKMIEMDYFDIYYSHGLIGFLLFFSLSFYVVYKSLKNSISNSYDKWTLLYSLFLVFILSFFTGHILTAPSVSYLVIILIISIYKGKTNLLVIGKRELKEKDWEIDTLQDRKYNKLEVLCFKIFHYKRYDYSYSHSKENLFLAKIASNHILE